MPLSIPDSPFTVSTIRAWQPLAPGSPDDWRTSLGQIIVEVQLESGIIGFGVGGGGAAAIHVIDSIMRRELLHKEFVSPLDAHEHMCVLTSFYGLSGIVPMAISGIDLAIWDAYAKSLNSNVLEILNPDCDPDICCPMYQTVFDDATALQAVEQGMAAVKLHLERYGSAPAVAEIADLVHRTRDAIGPDCELMLDAFGKWSVSTTCDIAERISRFDIAWIEEPLLPQEIALYTELCQRSPIPIAGGEHEYLLNGFRRLVEARAHDIYQPDVNWCGGLSTLIAIYELAIRNDVRVCPHRGSEPFALPAILALDPTPLAESGREWFTAITPLARVEQGRVTCNTGLGFGIEVSNAHPKTSSL
jgi:L-alanine-DL-glutamate epimerase-like enolase superfamily enzyme